MQTKQSQSHLQMRALTEGAVMVALATRWAISSSLNCLRAAQSVRHAAAVSLLRPLGTGQGTGLLLRLRCPTANLRRCLRLGLDLHAARLHSGLWYHRFHRRFPGKKGRIFWATVVGCVLRFVVHFISGVTIYRIYAPEQLFNTTFTNPWLYSAAYNGSYVGLDMVLCLVIFALLSHPMRKYLTGQDLAV